MLGLQQALAWDDRGHRVVCEIAFREISADTRERVKALIRIDPEFRYFSDACVWADHPRKRAKEHFINVPRSTASIRDTRCRLADQCLFTAIDKDLKVLGDRRSSDSERLAALKFLGHWVGDIHQPLHVAFEDDHGGNAILEDGPRGVPLHKVWDREIFAAGPQGGARAVAAELHRGIGAGERTAWRATGPADWAEESFAIATSADVGYCFRKDRSCWYGPRTRRYEDGARKRTLPVDTRYLRTHLPTVIERLKMAGVRLAYLLDQAL